MIPNALRRHFRIETTCVQQLEPKIAGQRFEGIGFSEFGDILGVVTADTNALLLFRRRSDGLLEEEPYQRIAGLLYPHDVSFATCGDISSLAVAQRAGVVSVFQQMGPAALYDPEPVCEIRGPESRLETSDGVAFVPPRNDYLAACNLLSGTISFFRRTSVSPLRFEATPDFELRHESLDRPDGLAFSSCGSYLATANHGSHSVSIFKRRSRAAKGESLYGPEPTIVITDPAFRHPHSVAVTPRGHLAVTNAGANYFSIYRINRRFFAGAPPVYILNQQANDESVFREVNAENKMEGGPKGIAVHGTTLAICGPEVGVKLYSFHE